MIGRREPNTVRVPVAPRERLDRVLRMPRVKPRSQDGAVTNTWVERPGECFDHLPAVVNAMRRVSARHMVARVEPVLAQHDVLTRDIRLVRATAVVVAGHA